jgi:hypothetical protein
MSESTEIVENTTLHEFLKEKLVNLANLVEEHLNSVDSISSEAKLSIIQKFKLLTTEAAIFDVFLQQGVLPYYDNKTGTMDELRMEADRKTIVESTLRWRYFFGSDKEYEVMQEALEYEFPDDVKQKIRRYFQMFAEVYYVINTKD